MTPDQEFSLYTRKLLSLMGCGHPHAGPAPDAPMRRARDILSDILRGGELYDGTKCDAFLVVIRRRDLPTLQSALTALDAYANEMKRGGRR